MSLFPVCDDPVIRTLRRVFRANIVRIPEQRIRPLCVIAKNKKAVTFHGTLDPLLIHQHENRLTGLKVERSKMANVSGTRSRHVNADLGLDILDGFLRGFGLPSAGIRAEFRGASKVSFSFNRVQRTFIDPGDLGQSLKGARIDSENPAAASFLGQAHSKLLVIDAVIGSSDFSIRVEDSTETGFKLNVPAIENLVINAKPEFRITSNSGLEIEFRGREDLGFAFSCLQLDLSTRGKIHGLSSAGKLPVLGLTPSQSDGMRKHPTGEGIHAYSPARCYLYSRVGLVEWDNP